MCLKSLLWKKVFWDGGPQNWSWDNIDLDQETRYYKLSQALECISENRIFKQLQLLTALLENQEPSENVGVSLLILHTHHFLTWRSLGEYEQTVLKVPSF